MISSIILIVALLSKITYSLGVVSEEDLGDTYVLNRNTHVLEKNRHEAPLDFEARRNCMGETFNDVVRKYRRMLQNDGALVDFVSADALTDDRGEIDPNSCAVNYEDIKRLKGLDVTGKLVKYETEDKNVTGATGPNSTNNDTVNTTEKSDNRTTKTVLGITLEKPKSPDIKGTTIDTITTEASVKEKNKKLKKDEEKVRRASDYLFSSIEYYEDSGEFADDICPDDVEVVTLELDEIRSYDVQCEQLTEWRSLE